MQMLVRRRAVLAGSTLLAAGLVRGGARAAGSPGLTTHVLDVTSGKPAEGVRIDFSQAAGEAAGESYRLIRTVHTNADGRNGEPLLTPETMKAGQYQLVFHIGAYFTRVGVALPDPPFLDKAVVQFGMADATAHYHVPLLASPWSYTTYRGS